MIKTSCDTLTGHSALKVPQSHGIGTVVVAAVAQLPASFWSPGLKPHIKELPRFVALEVFRAPWHAQILLCGAQEVLRGLYEVHGCKVVQQQLLCDPPHTRATVCRAPVWLSIIMWCCQAKLKATEAATCVLPSLAFWPVLCWSTRGCMGDAARTVHQPL